MKQIVFNSLCCIAAFVGIGGLAIASIYSTLTDNYEVMQDANGICTPLSFLILMFAIFVLLLMPEDGE